DRSQLRVRGHIRGRPWPGGAVTDFTSDCELLATVDGVDGFSGAGSSLRRRKMIRAPRHVRVCARSLRRGEERILSILSTRTQPSALTTVFRGQGRRPQVSTVSTAPTAPSAPSAPRASSPLAVVGALPLRTHAPEATREDRSAD